MDNIVLLRLVYLMAHREGIKVMLDGGAGDLALGAPHGVTALMRKGQFIAAAKEAYADQDVWGKEYAPALSTIGRSLGQALAPEWLKDQRRKLLAQHFSRRDDDPQRASRDLARDAGLASRREKLQSLMAIASFGGQTPSQRIMHPYEVVGIERYNRVASSFGIEPRDPFLDLNVIEFCRRLPRKQLRSDGWPKLLLRKAMVGNLPDNVRWRKGKQHLGPKFQDALLAYRRKAGLLDANNLNALKPYAKQEWLAQQCAKLSDGTQPDQDLHEAIYLSSWIRRQS